MVRHLRIAEDLNHVATQRNRKQKILPTDPKAQWKSHIF